MTKVLIIWRAYGRNWGGVQVQLMDWLGQVDASKSQVSILSPAGCIRERLAATGGPTKYLDISEDTIARIFGEYDWRVGKDELAQSGFWRPFSIWYQFLSKIRPDSIVLIAGHLFTYPLPCVLAAFLAARGHVYMTVHSMAKLGEFPPKKSRMHFGLVPGIGLWWYRQVWKRTWSARLQARLCHKTLAVGNAIRDKLVTSYGYPPRKVITIRHGVDTDRFCPAPRVRKEVRRAWGIPDHTKVIVSTARLSSEKGVDRLLRAYDRLRTDCEDPWLVLAGDGPLRSQVERLVSMSRRKAHIKMVGRVNDVCALLQASDIFVLSSDSEGFGIALVEAMSTGLVCIATRGGGPSEIITDGENGYLVDISDDGVLFGLQKVLRLDAVERNRLGQVARSTVVDKFDLRQAVRHALTQLDIAQNSGISGEGLRNSGEAPMRDQLAS